MTTLSWQCVGIGQPGAERMGNLSILGIHSQPPPPRSKAQSPYTPQRHWYVLLPLVQEGRLKMTRVSQKNVQVTLGRLTLLSLWSLRHGVNDPDHLHAGTAPPAETSKWCEQLLPRRGVFWIDRGIRSSAPDSSSARPNGSPPLPPFHRSRSSDERAVGPRVPSQSPDSRGTSAQRALRVRCCRLCCCSAARPTAEGNGEVSFENQQEAGYLSRWPNIYLGYMYL